MRVGVSGRFRMLAAGGRSRRGSSILLFEHDAYGLYGGQTIVRVQDAPYAIFCQGHRCAAPASAQAPTPRPAHQRRLPALMPPHRTPFKAPHQAPAPKRTNKQPQKNPSPALSQTRVSQFYNRHSEAQTQAPQNSKNLTAPRRNAAPTRTYSRPGTQSW